MTSWQWCLGLENLTPSSQNLDFASAWVQRDLVFSHVQETTKFLKEQIIYVFVTVAHPNTDPRRLFSLPSFLSFRVLPKKRRKAEGWGASILVSRLSALCCEVQWFHTATKLAQTSPFHQLSYSLYHCSQEEIIKKKKKNSCQSTVTGFYFKITLCWLYLYETGCHIL